MKKKYETPSDAINLIIANGGKFKDGIVYVKKNSLGLRKLGAVDFLLEHKFTVIYTP